MTNKACVVSVHVIRLLAGFVHILQDQKFSSIQPAIMPCPKHDLPRHFFTFWAKAPNQDQCSAHCCLLLTIGSFTGEEVGLGKGGEKGETGGMQEVLESFLSGAAFGLACALRPCLYVSTPLAVHAFYRPSPFPWHTRSVL